MIKKKTKFRLIDFFVSILCLSLCTVCGYLCYKEIDRRTEGRTEIASIKNKYHIAQRKVVDSVVWEMLKQNSALYNEDMVLTSNDSSALITYKNSDTVVQLFDNAMVQIFNESKILVMNGDVDIETDSEEMIVQTPDGGLIVVQPGSKLSASEDASGQIYCVVLKGAATIVYDDVKVKLTSEGEPARFRSDLSYDDYPVSVTSISKNHRVFTFDDKGREVYLKWNVSALYKNQKVLIETSSDKDFSKDVQIYQEISGDSKVLKVPVGKTYWKVYAEDKRDCCAQGVISVVKIEKPVLKAPYDESVFYETDNLPVIDFSWEPSDYADYYKIQISGDKEFNSILYEKDVFSEKISLNYFMEGNYFWRIVPHYEVNDIGFVTAEETRNFKVIKKDASSFVELELEPVIDVNEVEKDTDRLLFPTDNYFVESTRLRKLNFKWKLSKKNINARVIVQFSDDKDFDFIIKEIEAKKDSVTVDNLFGSVIYWRICILTEDGKKSFTDANCLNIKSVYEFEKEIKENIDKTEDKQSLTEKENLDENKTEKKNLENKKVTVIKKKETKKRELPDETEKKPVKTEEKKAPVAEEKKPVKTEEKKEPVPEEKKTVITEEKTKPVVEEKKEPVVEEKKQEEQSPSVQTENRPPAPIVTPVLMSPVNSMVIDNVYLKENKAIIFTWEKDLNALDYKIVIYKKNKNETKQIFESNVGAVSEFKFTKLNVLDLGDFEWHLISYGEGNQVKESIGSFKIDIVVPSKVTTKKPGKQYGE